MFVMVSENKCPFCGVDGEEWKRSPRIYRCPRCCALFNQYGIIFAGEREEEKKPA